MIRFIRAAFYIVAWIIGYGLILGIGLFIFAGLIGCESSNVPDASSPEVERLLRPDLDQCCECVWNRCVTGQGEAIEGYALPGQGQLHELWTDRCVESDASIASTYFAGCVDRQCRDLPCGRSNEPVPNIRR